MSTLGQPAPVKLVGEDAKDLSGKLMQLKIGEALTLPSPMSGLSNEKMLAVLHSRTSGTKAVYTFDLLWHSTWVGRVKATDNAKSVLLEMG